MKRILPVLFLVTQVALLSAFEQEGVASWYGGEFHGRQTSSGEVYDKREFTAAHRTLPFNTRLRVTNLENGRSVIVRVTDRGPFVKGRILDVSEAAAERIGLVATGTARVRIESIEPLADTDGTDAPRADGMGADLPAAGIGTAADRGGTEQEARRAVTAGNSGEAVTPYAGTTAAQAVVTAQGTSAAGKTVAPARSTRSVSVAAATCSIQVASFSRKENAAALFGRLTRAGFSPAYETAGRNVRVIVEDVPLAELEPSLARLADLGYPKPLVRR